MPASAPRALQTELRNCVENLTLKDLVTFLQEKGHALTDSVNAHVTKHPELGKMSILQILCSSRPGLHSLDWLCVCTKANAFALP
jgi:hypothetical protein